MNRSYSQTFSTYESVRRETLVEHFTHGTPIDFPDPIASSRSILQCMPKESDDLYKHEQARVINLIGRNLSEWFPTKTFDIRAVGTLEGVKYKITFRRNPLTENQYHLLDTNLRTISLYISKRFGNVCHLDYCR